MLYNIKSRSLASVTFTYYCSSTNDNHYQGFGTKVKNAPRSQLPKPTSGPKPDPGQERISEEMPEHSQICWEGCPTNHGKSSKSRRRILSHITSLLFLIYGLLKMSSGSTVPDPDPELMNAQNFDFAKPKLFFKNISRYAATSTYIHVRIPFNFTTVFNTKQAIAKVYSL
jgi:hypothetical protein